MLPRVTATRSRSRTLGLEQLESRLALDGGIQAIVSGGSLRITGDNLNNQIRITQFTPETFIIASRDGTTLINGQAAAQTLSGVTKDVNVSLGGGNDIVDLAGANNAHIAVNKRLSIDTGAGNDQVLLAFVACRELSVNTGNGDDTVQVGTGVAGSGITVSKSANIATGSGQDGAAIANSIFRRGLSLDLGSENDRAGIQASSFGKRSTISGGAGVDAVAQAGNSGKLKFLKVEQKSGTLPAPTAASDTATAVRGGSASINVAANDTAAVGTLNLSTIAITQQPTSGTATANSDGTVTYANNNAAATSDSFQYTIRDQLGTVSSAAVVSLTITAAPLAGVNDTASIVKGAANVTGNVLTNDTGGTGTRTVTAVNSAAASVASNVAGQFGTFRINADGSFTYTLDNANTSVSGLTDTQTLTDTMAYTLGDGASTATASLQITIRAS